MNLVFKCVLVFFAVSSIILAVFVKFKNPKFKKRRKIHSAMKTLQSAAKDIANMVK